MILINGDHEEEAKSRIWWESESSVHQIFLAPRSDRRTDDEVDEVDGPYGTKN